MTLSNFSSVYFFLYFSSNPFLNVNARPRVVLCNRCMSIKGASTHGKLCTHDKVQRTSVSSIFMQENAIENAVACHYTRGIYLRYSSPFLPFSPSILLPSLLILHTPFSVISKSTVSPSRLLKGLSYSLSLSLTVSTILLPLGGGFALSWHLVSTYLGNTADPVRTTVQMNETHSPIYRTDHSSTVCQRNPIGMHFPPTKQA